MKYYANYKYILAEDEQYYTQICPLSPITTEFVQLDSNGLMTLKAGFPTDGPSGPSVDTKTFMRGAFFHDGLYMLLRKNLLHVEDARHEADKLLRKICREDGMSWFRAWYVYRAVRLGSEHASHHGRKIQEAP